MSSLKRPPQSFFFSAMATTEAPRRERGATRAARRGEAAPTTTGRAAERADERKLRAEGAATAWQTDIAIG